MNKRILNVFFILLITVLPSAVFAQSTKYMQSLNKAKSYESQEDYAYALGNYFDALEFNESSANTSDEAFVRFEDIISKISSAEIFEAASGEEELKSLWKSLLVQTENYFGENVPLNFTCDDIRKNPSRNNSYTVGFSAELNQKYLLVTDALKSGLSKVYKDSWCNDIPRNWPYFSVHTSLGSALKHNIPLVAYPTDVELSDGYYEPYTGTKYMPAYLFAVSRSKYILQEGFGENDETLYRPLTVSFNILDASNNVLEQVLEESVGYGNFCLYSFNVSSENARTIDRGRARVYPYTYTYWYGKIYDTAGSTNSAVTRISRMTRLDLRVNNLSMPAGTEKIEQSRNCVYKNLVQRRQKEKEEEEHRIAEKKRREEEEARRIAEEKRLDALRQAVFSELDSSFVELPSGSVPLIEFTESDAEGTPLYVRTKNSARENVSSFSILRTEVTQRMYEAVMKQNPSEIVGENFPVTNVSWFDAVVFCNTLSEMSGLECSYRIEGENVHLISGANGYRLPFESEWEYAARGGKKQENFPFAGNKKSTKAAWSRLNSSGTLHECAKLLANAYGLYDMSGNVSEWCWNSSCNGYYLRGGSFASDEEALKVFARSVRSAADRTTGFRIVRN